MRVPDYSDPREPRVVDRYAERPATIAAGADAGLSGLTLGEAFPAAQARVRELLGEYRAIGPSGTFGVAVLEDVLRRADVAVISGDLPQMIALYQELQGCR